MTAIAQQLDQTLSSLPAATAASVERLVWDVINVVTQRPPSPIPEPDSAVAVRMHQAHWRQVDTMLDALEWSDFERPSQGESEVREDG